MYQQCFFVIMIAFFGIAQCGAPDAADLRGENICNPYNSTGYKCERANFEFVDLPVKFEALAKQTISWSAFPAAVSYELKIDIEENCQDPVQTISDLTETSTVITIQTTGSFYLCLSMKTVDDSVFESLDSGAGIAVIDSTTALLDFGSTPSIEFGDRVIGSEIFASVPLSNIGVSKATELTIKGMDTPFYFLGAKGGVGSFPGSGGTCTTEIEVDANCKLVIAYKAIKAGVFTDQLLIGYHNGAETVELPLSISGSTLASAKISISPSVVDFGNIAINGTADKTLTLKNSGDVQATKLNPSVPIAPLFYKGRGDFPGIGGTCATTLDAGATCTVVLEFAPTSAGDLTQILTINYGDGAGSAVVSQTITGKGVNP